MLVEFRQGSLIDRLLELLLLSRSGRRFGWPVLELAAVESAVAERQDQLSIHHYTIQPLLRFALEQVTHLEPLLRSRYRQVEHLG